MKSPEAEKRPVETAILFCLAAGCQSSGQPLFSLLSRQNFPWPIFVQTVCAKGVRVLAYRRLKTCPPENPQAKEALEQLRAAYLIVLTRNYYYLEELKKVLNTFCQRHLSVIPLKGILLSARLYGDIASRDESADFDLLVKEEDKEEAGRILEGLGYANGASEQVKEWQWYYRFSKPGSKVIELHWDITMMGRSRERIEGLWQGAALIERDGIQYHDFNPETLLLYLSAHLVSSDSFRTLRCACDIRRLLEKYSSQIDWDNLLQKAKKWRLDGSLYTALTLNRDLFGCEFPLRALKQLAVSLPKRIFIRVFANKKVVLREGLRRILLDEFLAYVFFEITEARCLKDCLVILKRVVFPPRQAMGQRSYILRIFKGIVKLVLPKPA